MQKNVKLKDPRTCRIFFSSPFGGMEEEREELTKKFFPQIHHACNAKGIKFVPVDMRWGITKEAADNAQVMNICLREVERSDFFVGFFGQRYGWHSAHTSNDVTLMQNFDNAIMFYPWVDKLRNRSMTEIEWRAGHLNNPGELPTCFCFRDKEFDDAKAKEAEEADKPYLKGKFTCENEYAAEKLKALTDEVLATQDKTYGVMMNYKTPQEGAKFIFDKIWYFVTEVALKDVSEEETPPVLKLRQVHDQFAKSKTHLYCGCEQYFGLLNDKLFESKSQGVLVTGPAGCGKSSLLASWVQSLQNKCPHLPVIYHFIGCAPGTERPKAILERLLLELKSAFPAYDHKNPEPPGRTTPRTPDKDDNTANDNKSGGDEKDNSTLVGSAPENSNGTVLMERSNDGQGEKGNGDGDSSRIPSHDVNRNKKGVEDRNNCLFDDKDLNSQIHIAGSTSSSLPVEGNMDSKDVNNFSLKGGGNDATSNDQNISKQEMNSEVLAVPMGHISQGTDNGSVGPDVKVPVEEVVSRQAKHTSNMTESLRQPLDEDKKILVGDVGLDLLANQAMHVLNDTKTEGPALEKQQIVQREEIPLDFLANQAMHISTNQAMHVSNDTNNQGPALEKQQIVQSPEFPLDLLANQAMHVTNDTKNEGPALEKQQIIQREEFPLDLIANQAMHVSNDKIDKGPGSDKEKVISDYFKFDFMANQAMHVSNPVTSEQGPSSDLMQIADAEDSNSDVKKTEALPLLGDQSNHESSVNKDESGVSKEKKEEVVSDNDQVTNKEEKKDEGVSDNNDQDTKKEEQKDKDVLDNKDQNIIKEEKKGIGVSDNKDQNIMKEEKKEEGVSDKNDQDARKEEKESKSTDVDKKKAPEQKKTSQQLLNEVKDLLKSISQNGEKVIIVIDALNQQQKFEKTVKHLYWLPETFPKDVSFICSSLNSDKASYDLLVVERKMEALPIEPYKPELQLEICVESLKVSGKELSPHQLDRIVCSNETTNPLFLKLIIYELSIYGSFRKLDEKIDSLIYVNGVRPLLQVVLTRLEEDYNSKEYHGNLVKDVLCCLIASKKGVSESEIVKILSIPSNLWSPLFFALEHLLVQYTGLLGFAFTEMHDAVKERYLSDPSNINSYKKLLIDFFDATRRTMKPWDKNSGLEYTRVMDELPWLQQDIGDKESLINTLSDISIMKKMISSNGNDLLELWQSTGLTWSAVTSLYMKAFDLALVNLYQEQEEGVLETVNSPGSMLRSSLQSLRMLFDTAYYPPGTEQAMKREINILENCRSKYTPEKKAEYLRDSRYYLAVAYADRQNYEDALPLYFHIMEECERILKDKEDSPAEEMLAFSCNGLGLVYYGQQDYPKALQYLQRSESMHHKRKEKRHQAASATNIGLVYINQRHYNMALESFGKAMQLYTDHFFGEMPLDVGNLLTNIALTYRRMKDLDKAEEYYHKSLEMKVKNVGWYHPVVAVAYMNLGTLEVHRKNHAKAEEWTRKAIHIYELNEVPVTDKSHRMCRENLCMNMLKQGKQSEMLPLYFEVVNILIDNGWIAECIVPLHRDMIDFIMDETDVSNKNKKIEKILLAILSSPKRRACFAYQLATMDSKLPSYCRPKRPENLTLQHFLEEFPKDSKLKILHVTDCLAKEDKYEDILSICLELHDKEENLKESAFSFAAEALSDHKFYQSAKKIVYHGFEKYPGHMELVNSLIPCLIGLKEAEDLLPYVPAMLETSDWELLNESNLINCGKALESIDADLAEKCYTKVIQEGRNLYKESAQGAKRRFLLSKEKPRDKIDG